MERFGFWFMNIPQISKIFLKPGEYLPVTLKSSHIVAENDNIPVTILNVVANGIGGGPFDLKLMEWFGFYLPGYYSNIH
jgi:hypothetical protein